MFINNKKMWWGLFALTIGAGIAFHFSVPMPLPKYKIEMLSQDFNKNLPIDIDHSVSLRKTSVDTIEGIYSFDFYYLVNSTYNEVNLTQFRASYPKLITQACSNWPTKNVLEHSTVVRYRYITTDQKTLDELTIFPRDCPLKK